MNADKGKEKKGPVKSRKNWFKKLAKGEVAGDDEARGQGKVRQWWDYSLGTPRPRERKD